MDNSIQIVKEERDGKNVVIINSEVFEKNFKPIKTSRKEKKFTENNIPLKYLNKIHSSKGRYTFKMTDIPNLEELKKLIELNEKFENMKVSTSASNEL